MESYKIQTKPIYYRLFYSSLIIINTLMFIRVVIFFPYHRLITHETLWSFYLSSIYLIAIFIIDTNLFNCKSSLSESYNSFFRNYFSVVAYSYCYTITIEFWLILFLGLAFGSNPFSEEKVISKTILYDTLYLHLGITIIMLIDLFCTKRKLVKNKTLIFIINVIFFWYCVVVLFTNYVLFKPAYPFMKDAGVILMVIVFIVSLILVNFSYYLHIFLVKIINKGDEVTLKKNI